MALKLKDLLSLPNIVPKLNTEQLADISGKVVRGHDEDLASRRNWEVTADAIFELAHLEYSEKNTPFIGASNVKLPLITVSVIQSAARTLGEILRGRKIVEVAINGKYSPEKEERARIVANHMNWQLLIQNDDWKFQFDQLLHVYATVGMAFKKTYYDPVDQRNKSDLLTYKEFVVNHNIKSLEEARRATHVLKYHTNDLIERKNLGIYQIEDMEKLQPDSDLPNQDVHTVLEQHRYLDLDGDGYEEPYIVTVHKASGIVLRVVARFDEEDILSTQEGKIVKIKPIHYFTDFHFIRAMDGSYHSLGFGTLLYSTNEASNSIANELIDAGKLANVRGGLVGSALRLRNRDIKAEPGKFTPVEGMSADDIRKQIYEWDFKEPSQTLLALLQFLTQSADKITNLTPTMLGQANPSRTSQGTFAGMMEAGSKIFASIQQRLFYSLTKEFKKLYRLNRLFLDNEVYFNFHEEQQRVLREDYEDQSLDIAPVAEPALSSDLQRLQHSQALLNMMQFPGINLREVQKEFLLAIGMEPGKIDALVPPPDPNASPPLEVLKTMSEIDERGKKLELKAHEVFLKEHKLQLEIAKSQTEMSKMKAEIINLIADAEAKEAGIQIEQYKNQLKELEQQVKLAINDNDNQTKRAGLVSEPNDSATVRSDRASPTAEAGSVGPGALPPS